MIGKRVNKVLQAVITGASSGIGEQFAHQLADAGYSCLLVARREDRLKQVVENIRNKGGRAEYIVADLTRVEDVERIVVHLETRHVDLLVNNAGYGGFGFFAERDINLELDMLQLNMISLYRLTRAVIPQMLKRKSGGIIQVASVVGFQPMPFMAAYAASKSFVLHYSEAIATELKGTGVQVMALCPGGTATEFVGRAKVNGRLKSVFTMSAQKVVRLALRGFAKRKHVVVTGNLNSMMSSLYRYLPRKWMTKAIIKMFGSQHSSSK
jgi:short-subunit dehydrogenase